MKNTVHNLIIIALNTNDTELERKMLTALMPPEWRTKYKVKQVEGCYKGVKETSWIVAVDTAEQIELLTDLAWLYNQQEVWELRKQINGSRRIIAHTAQYSTLHGFFVSCSEQEALQQDGYTFDLTTNQYFIQRNTI